MCAYVSIGARSLNFCLILSMFQYFMLARSVGPGETACKSRLIYWPSLLANNLVSSTNNRWKSFFEYKKLKNRTSIINLYIVTGVSFNFQKITTVITLIEIR